MKTVKYRKTRANNEGEEKARKGEREREKSLGSYDIFHFSIKSELLNFEGKIAEISQTVFSLSKLSVSASDFFLKSRQLTEFLSVILREIPGKFPPASKDSQKDL